MAGDLRPREGLDHLDIEILGYLDGYYDVPRGTSELKDLGFQGRRGWSKWRHFGAVDRRLQDLTEP